MNLGFCCYFGLFLPDCWFVPTLFLADSCFSCFGGALGLEKMKMEGKNASGGRFWSAREGKNRVNYIEIGFVLFANIKTVSCNMQKPV